MAWGFVSPTDPPVNADDPNVAIVEVRPTQGALSGASLVVMVFIVTIVVLLVKGVPFYFLIGPCLLSIVVSLWMSATCLRSARIEVDSPNQRLASFTYHPFLPCLNMARAWPLSSVRSVEFNCRSRGTSSGQVYLLSAQFHDNTAGRLECAAIGCQLQSRRDAAMVAHAAVQAARALPPAKRCPNEHAAENPLVQAQHAGGGAAKGGTAELPLQPYSLSGGALDV